MDILMNLVLIFVISATLGEVVGLLIRSWN